MFDRRDSRRWALSSLAQYTPSGYSASQARRIERGFSLRLWAETRPPEPQRPDFGHSEGELSGLHKDLNGQIRQAGPEPSGMEAHVEEGGKFAGVTASRVHYVPSRDGRRFLINTTAVRLNVE